MHELPARDIVSARGVSRAVPQIFVPAAPNPCEPAKLVGRQDQNSEYRVALDLDRTPDAHLSMGRGQDVTELGVGSGRRQNRTPSP